MNQLSESTFEFLALWHKFMYILSPVALALGILIMLYFKMKYAFLKTQKSRYDYISEYEYRYLFATNIAIGLALFFIFNTYNADVISKSMLWFFIRLFLGICIGVLWAYVAQLILKFYYPQIQHRKLKVLRYSARINPKTGNKMKLLSEDEEDAFLDEGMQAEEDVFSVDYDVWIDVETNETIIEKYEGRLHALECDRCGFRTLKLEKEEIIKTTSEHEDGELLKHYKCTYCKRVKRKTVKLSNHKSASEYEINEHTKFIDNPLHIGQRVILVKVEVHSNEGEIKNYDFQNTAEAQKFLLEFDFEKIVHEE